ncbi:MAG: PDDEXK nuclease domain-containing protein [Candidatus Omnitrophica bacterium]|nr:PDDEXK nuclease domain-containing protein [Candidatus Omnitrophota bacterium]
MKKRAVRSVDIALVVRNWLFGWYIVEYENAGVERAELYGKKLISKLSSELRARGLKGVSPTNLRKFCEFYQSYAEIQQTVSVTSLEQGKSKIRQTVSGQSLSALIEQPRIAQTLSAQLSSQFTLGWSHYVTLLTIKSTEERCFYEIEAIENNWSIRELNRQIATSLYERLALSRDKEKIKELSVKGQLVGTPEDVIKNPYILEFLNLPEHSHYSEHELETAIIDRIEHFLLELGKGFLFEARQKRFTFDDDHFYVDLVFYNRLLRCYVLIDLKRDKLSHQDLGQMQMYVNYFDRYVKIDEEAPTVGIVLCHRKSDALVELTIPENSNIHASQYQLYLPSKEELKKQIEESLREQGEYE